MKLSESQLSDLSRTPETPDGLTAYSEVWVREALAASPTLDGVEYSVFSTGSMKHGTNITFSDLDFLVVQHSASTDSRSRFEQWRTLRASVSAALVTQLGGIGLTETNKCLNIDSNPDDLPSLDILPCLSLTEGEPGAAIEFWTAQDASPIHIVSHPGLHTANSTVKNTNTAGEYRNTVRALKAIKGVLAQGGLDPATAPSHLLECLAHNLPDRYFDGDTAETARIITETVLNGNNLSKMTTVSGAYKLFGGGATQWKPADAKVFFEGAADILPDSRRTAYPTLSPASSKMPASLAA
jgi:hypothetical protein